jgi:signal transduction histidine kinase
MTAEALSNVHRHTGSRTATVHLVMVNNSLQLMVENDVIREPSGVFRPASIVERAEALDARSEISVLTKRHSSKWRFRYDRS